LKLLKYQYAGNQTSYAPADCLIHVLKSVTIFFDFITKIVYDEKKKIERKNSAKLTDQSSKSLNRLQSTKIENI